MHTYCVLAKGDSGMFPVSMGNGFASVGHGVGAWIYAGRQRGVLMAVLYFVNHCIFAGTLAVGLLLALSLHGVLDFQSLTGVTPHRALAGAGAGLVGAAGADFPVPGAGIRRRRRGGGVGRWRVAAIRTHVVVQQYGDV